MQSNRLNMKRIPLALALALTGIFCLSPADNSASDVYDCIEDKSTSGFCLSDSVRLKEEKVKRAADFQLEDQFRNKKSHQFPKDKWSIIFVAGRKGSEQIEPWAKAIYDVYGESVEQIGIADVSNVPGPLQGLIRSLFRKTITYPILMDWEGKVVNKFGYKKDHVRLLVVEPGGEIKEIFDGPLSESGKARIFKALPDPKK